jgi:hypothetical protein
MELNIPTARLKRSRNQSHALISAITFFALVTHFCPLAGDPEAHGQTNLWTDQNQDAFVRSPTGVAGIVRYTNNGTWLDYAYLSKPEYWTQVPRVAARMKEDHVHFWFLNVGSMDASGKLTGGVTNAVHFLNELREWEDQNHYRFTVFAWLNANWPKVDLTNTVVRANMAGECGKLVSTNVSNSYIVGASRAFDGIQLDFEPCGQRLNVFDSLVNFFDQVHAKFAAIGVADKLTSFTPEKYGTNNSEWVWRPQFYYDLAPHLDLLCVMTYDSGIKTGSTYQDWIENQTTNILRAVSGKWWNNDAQHPPPTNRVKVMIGFPAFPNSKWHTNTAENIVFASSGVKAALAELSRRGDVSARYFEGAAVYLHSDGTGTNGYANCNTDWHWFQEHWLNAR